MRTAIVIALAGVALLIASLPGTVSTFSATVAPSASLTAATDFRPLNSVAPVASGTKLLGNALTRTQGTWTNSNVTVTYTYQWQYCPAGINCVDIPSATGTSYTITLLSLQPILGVVGALPGDAGFRVVETATNTWGSTSTPSAAI